MVKFTTNVKVTKAKTKTKITFVLYTRVIAYFEALAELDKYYI